ncbi:MAG: NHL repeat-containing protein, partial [Candidatus Binatia bacterium]
VAAYGREGDLPGEFRDPCGIAVAKDGRIFVADTWNHRIQVLTAEGEPVDEWAPRLYGPRAIAIAPDDSVFVTDSGNRSVVRFSASGEVLGRFGADVLRSPIGIAIDAAGEIWVADAERRDVVAFDASGRRLRSFAVDGWAPGGIVEPYLEIGTDGVLWLTDPSGGRVLLYDRSGRSLGVAEASAPLSLPLGIALVDDAHAIVTTRDEIVTVTRPANSQRGGSS